MASQALPHGVQTISSQSHHDSRGLFRELFRQSWITETDFRQWNLITSHANSIRGVHVHFTHYDYLTVLQGHIQLGLVDLRQQSPTENMSVLLDLPADSGQSVLIPPGVAHGFLFLKESTCLFGVSHYWDVEDEKGCLYSDPDLRLGWEHLDQPILSEKDTQLPSLKALRACHPIHYQP